MSKKSKKRQLSSGTEPPKVVYSLDHPYAQFNDIGEQPVPLEGMEDRAMLRISSVTPYVLGAVYWENDLYHIWLHLAQHGGGVKAMNSVDDLITGQRAMELNAIEMVRVWNRNRGRYEEERDAVPRRVSMPREIISRHNNLRDVIAMSPFDVVEGHYGDMRSRIGRTEPEFILLFNATDAIETRYEQFFQQLTHRTFVPYLREWMPYLWGWMRSTEMILPTKSFGPVIGWRIRLQEEEILERVIWEMRPTGHFSIKERTRDSIAA